MRAIKIKEGIYWVGAIDWGVRNFHGYLTHRGTTYNSYLIIDEKITLIDTVKANFYEEMLGRIKSVIDPSKINYIVSNHAEMDHSGSLPIFKETYRDINIIASPNGEKNLKKHYNSDWNLKVVNTGDSLRIGKRTLQFVLMPMVHWPDSMATYIGEEKLLLPNDAFGQHIASSERFDNQFARDIVCEEAAKYYANIVLPFSGQVNNVLDYISKLKIEMIAPSHGIIWHSYLDTIIGLYKKWANNATDEKAIVIYDSMWGSTEIIAKVICNVFECNGIPSCLMGLKVNHISDIMTQILTAKYICVGSSTLNNNLLPTVSSFLTYMNGLAPKNRVGLAFGSYGWSGEAVRKIEEVMNSCGFKIMDSIKVQYVPDKDILGNIAGRVKDNMSKFSKI